VDYTDELDAVIHGLARQVHRQFRMVPFDDIFQHGRTWVLSHPQRVTDYLEDEDAKRGWRKLSTATTKAMQRMARSEKAFSSGYRPEDEAFYNAALVELVLPAVLNPELADAPPQGEQHEIRGAHDPAQSDPWPVHLADVGRALRLSELSVRQRGMLALRYGSHRPLAVVAAVYEVGIPEAEAELHDALRRIVARLGGERPAPCPRACEECRCS